MAQEVFVLHCRRCESQTLLELVKLDGQDHTVFRCRACGFLFSPPEDRARAAGVPPSPLRPDGEAGRRRLDRVATTRNRPPARG